MCIRDSKYSAIDKSEQETSKVEQVSASILLNGGANMTLESSGEFLYWEDKSTKHV